MANWLDERAKAAARGDAGSGGTGLSRRQLLQRSAVVAGTAWTAPMLLTATPAWAGASQCTGSQHWSICPGNATGLCCPSGEECVLDIITGAPTCDIPLGGDCGNSGNGNCAGGASICNDQHKPNNVCGGPGTLCTKTRGVCMTGLECSGGMCGGVGATCASTPQCYPGDKNSGAGKLTCQAGTCQP